MAVIIRDNFAVGHLILGAACILILAFPLWTNYSFVNVDNLMINTAIDSSLFKTSAYTLLVTSIPLMLDGLFDFIEIIRKPSIQFSPQFIGRSLITIACFLCSIQILELKHTPSIFGFTDDPILALIFTLFAVRVTLFTSILYICSSILPTIFTFNQSMVFNIIGCVVTIIRLYSTGQRDTGFTISGIIAFMFFPYALCMKFYWLFILLRRYHSMTVDDYTCILYVCVFILGLASIYIPILQNLITNDSLLHLDITECSEHSLTVMMSLLSAFMVLLSIIPGRISRYKDILHMNEIIQTKTNYVRFISHELRTPLNSVFLGINYTINQLQDEEDDNDSCCQQTLQDTDKDPLHTKVISTNRRHVDTLEEISEACNAALTILNELLLYDKLENGILELNKKDVNIMKMLEDASKMFSVQLRDKCIELSVYSDITDEMNDTVKDSRISPLSIETSLNISTKENRNISLNNSIQDINDTYNNDVKDSSSSSESYHIEIPKIDSIVKTTEKCTCASLITADDIVHIDSTKIIQVIRNIISNAIKFTSSGGHIIVNTYFQPFNNTEKDSMTAEDNYNTIWHRVSQMWYNISGSNINDTRHRHNKIIQPSISSNGKNNTMEIHGHLIIEIKDDGIGISDTDQLKLFHNIIQFNPDILQNGGGSGLGMWISKGIMDLHQGSISVHSKGENQGSTFTLKLPMTRKNTSSSSSFALPWTTQKTMLISNSIDKLTSIIPNDNQHIDPTPMEIQRVLGSSKSCHDHTSQLYSLSSPCVDDDTNIHVDHYIKASIDSIESIDQSIYVSRNSSNLSTHSYSDNNIKTQPFNPSAYFTTSQHSLPVLDPNSLLPYTYSEDIISRQSSMDKSMSTQTTSYSMNMTDTNIHVHDTPRILCHRKKSISLTSSTRSKSSSLLHPPPLPPTCTHNYHSIADNTTSNGNTESKLRVGVESIGNNISNTSTKSCKQQIRILNGYHILVVDDSSMNRKMLIRLLTSCGYTCDEAYDGCEAVKKVTMNANIMKTANQLDTSVLKIDTDSDECAVIVAITGSSDTCKSIQTSDTNTTATILPLSYDAILMDFMMPNMDGPTATAEIRKLGYTGPILGVTGNALQVDIDYFIRQGANQVLIKPIDSKVMQATLEGMYVFMSITNHTDITLQYTSL